MQVETKDHVPEHEIKCVLFDLDDTLWHCHPIIERADAKFHAFLANSYPSLAAQFPPEEYQKISLAISREVSCWSEIRKVDCSLRIKFLKFAHKICSVPFGIVHGQLVTQMMR